MSALRVPAFEYHVDRDERSPLPMAEEPVGPLRQVRIDLRVLLNQNDGTFDVTNQVADDIARILVNNLRARGYLVDPTAEATEDEIAQVIASATIGGVFGPQDDDRKRAASVRSRFRVAKR